MATRELLAQRETELALISSIQRGLAAKLDFQAIVDLVGDKLREVFERRLAIGWLDEKANLIHILYAYEHGRAADDRAAAARAGRPVRDDAQVATTAIVLRTARDYAKLP